MLATYAASRHRQIVPCCMISSVSHDNVSRLVTDRSMCFATALDKAFENIDCMSAILRCQAKNRFYESTQCLIQPRRVLWILRHLWSQQSMESPFNMQKTKITSTFSLLYGTATQTPNALAAAILELFRRTLKHLHQY